MKATGFTKCSDEVCTSSEECDKGFCVLDECGLCNPQACVENLMPAFVGDLAARRRDVKERAQPARSSPRHVEADRALCPRSISGSRPVSVDGEIDMNSVGYGLRAAVGTSYDRYERRRRQTIEYAPWFPSAQCPRLTPPPEFDSLEGR